MSEQLQKLVGDTKSDDVGRRRRLILGGGLGGAFAAFKSGSALAGGVCNSPSAFGSIAANPASSHKPHTFDGCNASSKGWYVNPGQKTPRTENWNGVSTDLTFGGAQFPPASGVTASLKLYEALCQPYWKSDFNLVVIYLDVKTGRANGVLSVSDVFEMWNILFNSAVGTGKFSGWNASTVQAFYTSWVGSANVA